MKAETIELRKGITDALRTAVVLPQVVDVLLRKRRGASTCRRSRGGWPVCSCRGGMCPGNCSCGCSHTPWPLVAECHLVGCGPSSLTCDQHRGDHHHQWVTFVPAVPARHPWFNGPGVPERCSQCGARKCDVQGCCLIRHHQDPLDHDFTAMLDLPADRQPETVEAWLR